MGRQFRHLLSSRAGRLLVALTLVTGIVAAAWSLGLVPRSLPGAGILVVDLRHGFPDKAETAPDGRRSVSAVTVLRTLDAARHDRRIAGVYLRVGGSGPTLAQAFEIADAVKRLRRADKFAVAWSDGFTAANLSDRVIAASTDEIWTNPGVEKGLETADLTTIVASESELPAPPMANQAHLWKQLLEQASQQIGASAAAEDKMAPADAVARAKGLSPPQQRQGPEARAERAALAWGGVEAGFVDLLTYRDVLDRRAADEPIIALVQVEGVIDILQGPGRPELAGPLAQRIRTAAADPRVKGIVMRISAVAASDEALELLVRSAEEARRRGTRAGISFGPVVPANAAALTADLPLTAPEGALLINLAPGARAADLAERARVSWQTGGSGTGDALAGEAVFLEHHAAVATVTAGNNAAAPTDGADPTDDIPRNTGLRQITWQNDVGTLLEMKDRLAGPDEGSRFAGLLLVPYEPKPSVWTRTKVRLSQFWKQIASLVTGTPDGAKR